MRLHNMNEINEFKQVIDNCESDVWMTDDKNSYYNMKSVLTQYAVCGKLLEDNNLELFAANQEDEYRLLDFLHRQAVSRSIA